MLRQEKQKSKSTKDKKRLQASLATLNKTIARGTENLLLADAESIPDMRAVLSGWRKQRDEIQRDLQATEGRSKGRNRSQIVDQAIQELEQLGLASTTWNRWGPEKPFHR